MQEKAQHHSSFYKSIGVFLVIPLIVVTSFSFPRPAHAVVLIAVIATVVVVDYVTCGVNLIWGCGGDGGGGGSAPVTTPATVLFSASPTTIDSGESSTLTWTSTFATSCTAAGGFSTGGATSGSASTGALTQTSTYQITCTGDGGTSAPASATVTVVNPSVSISTTPDRVPSGGATTISWDATNVNACTITRNGTTWRTLTAPASRALSGSATDTITAQTTYVISCTNNASATAATATKIVNIVTGFREF